MKVNTSAENHTRLLGYVLELAAETLLDDGVELQGFRRLGHGAEDLGGRDGASIKGGISLLALQQHCALKRHSSKETLRLCVRVDRRCARRLCVGRHSNLTTDTDRSSTDRKSSAKGDTAALDKRRLDSLVRHKHQNNVGDICSSQCAKANASCGNEAGG